MSRTIHQFTGSDTFCSSPIHQISRSWYFFFFDFCHPPFFSTLLYVLYFRPIEAYNFVLPCNEDCLEIKDHLDIFFSRNSTLLSSDKFEVYLVSIPKVTFEFFFQLPEKNIGEVFFLRYFLDLAQRYCLIEILVYQLQL